MTKQLLMTDNLAEFVSIKEAAEDILKVHPDTVRNLMDEGLLPAYRLGARLIRVKKSDLEKLFHLIPSAATK